MRIMSIRSLYAFVPFILLIFYSALSFRHRHPLSSSFLHFDLNFQLIATVQYACTHNLDNRFMVIKYGLFFSESIGTDDNNLETQWSTELVAGKLV